MRLTDRLGQRYGRLVVTGRAPNKGGKDTNARWHCECDCGSRSVAYGQDLARGKVKSCGCLNAERIVRHGMARTQAYRAWLQMIQRCENPNTRNYNNYGGRGIAVCDEWHDYSNFLRDMGAKPAGYTLDRRDNDKGYNKENCRWATTSQQNNNKRQQRRLTLNGRTQTVAEWVLELAPQTGLTWRTIASRLVYGWTVEQALTTPVGHSRK
jgi:hypothetical protein